MIHRAYSRKLEGSEVETVANAYQYPTPTPAFSPGHIFLTPLQLDGAR